MSTNFLLFMHPASVLTCRRYLSDRPRLANRRARARHVHHSFDRLFYLTVQNLSVFVLSFNWLTGGSSEREERCGNRSNAWAPPHAFFFFFVTLCRLMSVDRVLFPLPVTRSLPIPFQSNTIGFCRTVEQGLTAGTRFICTSLGEMCALRTF